MRGSLERPVFGGSECNDAVMFDAKRYPAMLHTAGCRHILHFKSAII
jgi:hypothetical protein